MNRTQFSNLLKVQAIKPSRRIRIKDIAEKAKVSIGTVDRVIHNRGEVNTDTRDKILKILEELDYHPNILASTLASKKTHQFAVLIPESPSPEVYWNQPLQGIERASNELQQYGIIINLYQFSQSDPDSFKSKTNEILSSKPEGVVMTPFFSRESGEFVQKLRTNLIPFVFIDSSLANCNQLSFIGQNSFQSGMLAAKLFDFSLSPNSCILVIHFGKELDNQNHPKQRELGFRNYFDERPDNNPSISTIEIDTTAVDNLAEVLDRELARFSQIDGIFVTNSQVFRVAEYLVSRKMQHIRLVGHDLIPQNADFLRTGVIDFLLCQRPEEQGYKAVQTLFQHLLLKKQVKVDNYTSIDIVTKENLDYYKEFNQSNYGSN